MSNIDNLPYWIRLLKARLARLEQLNKQLRADRLTEWPRLRLELAVGCAVLADAYLSQLEEALNAAGGSASDPSRSESTRPERYGLDAYQRVDLRSLTINPDIVRLLQREIAVKHQVIPVDCQGTTLTLAMADPSDIFAIDDVKFATGYMVEVVVADEAQILEAIATHYPPPPAA